MTLRWRICRIHYMHVYIWFIRFLEKKELFFKLFQGYRNTNRVFPKFIKYLTSEGCASQSLIGWKKKFLFKQEVSSSQRWLFNTFFHIEDLKIYWIFIFSIFMAHNSHKSRAQLLSWLKMRRFTTVRFLPSAKDINPGLNSLHEMVYFQNRNWWIEFWKTIAQSPLLSEDVQKVYWISLLFILSQVCRTKCAIKTIHSQIISTQAVQTCQSYKIALF